MATLKFELTIVPGMTIEYLRFDDYEPIEKRNYEIINHVCKNKEPIEIFPNTNKFPLKVEALGNYGFTWELNIWINDRKITDEPITETVDAFGKADYSGNIKWHS